MKTKHYLLGALAAMMLMTSCQDDTALMGNEGETAMVSFELTTPEIATRAYSDGTTATVLQYAVYEGETELTDLTKSVAKGNADTINISKKVNLQLTTGNTYKVIFWAAAPDAPYTVDFANKTMTVDYNGALSNKENRDAFYKIQEITVRGTQSETVELRRPFAQLNIGTNDYEASKKAGYEPKYSSVTVKGLGSTLNLWDGTVDAARNEITFDFNEIPTGETFPVAGYEYLAMNYLLVPAEQEVVDIEFSYGETAAAEKTRTVGSVPVQRNHRTNIYGQLLTSDVDINVVIVPDYDDDDLEADPLQLIAAVGGTYDATGDIDLTSTDAPYLEIDNGMVLNMNGHQLTSGSATDYGIIARGGSSEINEADIYSRGGGIGVVNGASVTFNSGSLEINTTSTSGRYLFYLEGEGSTLTINDGNFDFNKTQNQKRAYIYAGTGTTAYVKGGNFGKASTRSGYTAGILGDGTVIITGGTFGFDPTKWVADGYTVVYENGKYTVSKEVATVDQLEEALSSQWSVTLTETIDNGTDVISIQDNNVIINMDNQEVIAGGNGTNNYAFNLYGSNVEVNDANINGAGFAVLQESSVTVNSGTIAAKPGKSGRNMFYVTGNSTVTVNEGTYTFDRTSCYFVYVDAGSTCYINGGHFEKPLANSTSKDSFVNNASTGTVIITGGTFNVDPTKWLADGYKAEKNGKIWTVSAE